MLCGMGGYIVRPKYSGVLLQRAALPSYPDRTDGPVGCLLGEVLGCEIPVRASTWVLYL